MRFERDKLMRDRPAYSIRDRGYGLDQSPDLWLQSLPAYRHQLNAWQNGGDHLGSYKAFRRSAVVPHGLRGNKQGVDLFEISLAQCAKTLLNILRKFVKWRSKVKHSNMNNM